MKANRLGPIDIVGITLGVIAFGLVVASLAVMASNKPFFVRADVGGYFGSALREEKDEEVTGQYSEVEIRNVAGFIEITGREGDGVGVHSVKTAPTPAALEAIRVQIEPRGSRLVIEEKREPLFAARTGSISFSVSIPKGVKLVVAHSVSGSITVSGVEPGIDQALSTVSGSISSSESGDLEATTTSGSIGFSFAGKELKASTVSGSINGEIDSIETGGSVRLKTVSGSVQVQAFSGLDASVALSSVSGGVSCDFPITISEQKRNSLKGKVGSGAVPVDISTVSGRISINKQ
jgi:hypothetical protein